MIPVLEDSILNKIIQRVCFFSLRNYDHVFFIFHVYHPVVIVFTEKSKLKKLIQAVKQKSIPPPFMWIIGDSVLHQKPSERFMHQYGYIVEGGLVVRPESKKLDNFDEYFKWLLDNPTNTTNPWFHEFILQFSGCSEVNAITSVGLNIKQIPISSSEKKQRARLVMYSSILDF